MLEPSRKGQSKLTTPASQAQQKRTLSGQPYKEPGIWLPSRSAYPTPQEMAARVAGQATRPDNIKVALLAPLSGRQAPLGQAMVNAAQLAVFDIGGNGFELMPRDTGASPSGAVAALRDAIGSGAQLVIGPLFAAEVAAVKPEIKTSGINMLALSTDVSLAEPGAYVMGFAPTPQVERVISYAASQNRKRFAALVPVGPYGQIVAKAFEAAVKKNGGEVIAVEKKDTMISLAAKKDQIDALLLPFGGSELRKIAEQLTAIGFDKDKIKVLGTGLWDVPNLAGGQPFLIGGWYAAAEPEARQRFEESYQDTYGQPAPRLATLAYDATALAAVLVQRGVTIDRTTLTNPVGFAGLDGIFRLTKSGQIERGLAINEVREDGSRIVDPSPASFPSR